MCAVIKSRICQGKNRIKDDSVEKELNVNACASKQKKAVLLALWKYRKSIDFKKGNLQWLRVVGRRKEMIEIVEKNPKGTLF